MKPNFALSLSFEGIGLLARAQEGWWRVDEVALDAPDLARALSELRARADRIGPADGAVKLVIPNEQIRYLTLEDTGLEGDALKAAIEDALDGATPYAVADLAYDWSMSKGQVRVAAVARETLDEAEMFASGHSFVPVSFVARAPEGAFDGEVFFGAAKGWKGAAPERDDPIRIVPAPPAPKPKPAPAPEPAGQAPAAPPAHAAAPGNDPDGIDAPPAAPVSAPAQAPAAPPAIEAPAAAPAAGPGSAEETDPEMGPDAPPEAPKPSFASIRASRAASSGAAPAVAPPAPSTPAPRQRDGLKPRMTFGQKPVSVTAGSIPEVPPESSGSLAKSAVNFLSRRREKPAPAAAGPGPAETPPPVRPAAPPKPVKTSALLARRASTPEAPPATDPAEAERQRMTVFGARQKQGGIGGKPRYLGLMLTLALLVFLAGVAAWASVFLDEGLARFFPASRPATAVASIDAIETDAESAADEDAAIELARLDAGDAGPVSDAVAPGLSEPPVALPQPDITPEEAEATYAATGFWIRAPQTPDLPPEDTVANVYMPSIDAVVVPTDAVALAVENALAPDAPFASLPNPVPPDVTFDFDERGLVKATPQGALTPDGVLVFSGRPAVVPPLRPADAVQLKEPPEALAERARLQALRPKARPRDLSETNERANLGGFSRSELAQVRPKARTVSAKEEAEKDRTATRQAVAVSLSPLTRPRDFSTIVERARKSDPAPTAPATTQVASAARIVQPSIPSKASVTKAATVRNAINLRKINLIGVYGKPQSRRALVRLSNGRYKKVKVGDTLDGGRVAAISDNELRYTKNGRNLSISLPK